MRSHLKLVFAVVVAVALLALGPQRSVALAPASNDVGDVAGAPNGWTAGTVAAGTVELLSLNDPVQIDLPGKLVKMIKGDTALFYFSPTCPHCQHAMPEFDELCRRGIIACIGVALGAADPEQLAAFRQTYDVSFPFYVDNDRSFARATGASSTPSVYLVRPLPADAPKQDSVNAVPARSGDTKDLAAVLLYDAYLPWRRGSAGIVGIRQHTDAPFRDMKGYQSDTTCAACHIEESQSWQLTHHSVAYRTLVKREREMDQECASCHVTGLGQETGFVLGDHSSPLTNVSCESCHGPSGPHDGESTDARQTCQGCHDAKHSVAFTVDKGLPLLDHFAIDKLSEDEAKDRLSALWGGEAPRPLLAFPNAPTVGADTCKSCHSAEHKSWKNDPHGKAMAALKPAEATDVACVSCHATPARSGTPGSTLADYRSGEGVGCEACHGPGGAHAAAPSKDNIVGLGESCPECVIEAICTSCHTPRWDPNWELKARLAAATHKDH